MWVATDLCSCPENIKLCKEGRGGEGRRGERGKRNRQTNKTHDTTLHSPDLVTVSSHYFNIFLISQGEWKNTPESSSSNDIWESVMDATSTYANIAMTQQFPPKAKKVNQSPDLTINLLFKIVWKKKHNSL